jgi:hypothetical protein
MTAQVIALGKLVSPERLSELRGEGVVVQRDSILADLSLPDPRYGEEVVGELSDDELFLFAELAKLNLDLEAKGREIVGKSLSMAGEAIRNSDHTKPLMEALQNSNIMESASEDDARQIFTLQQRVNMLHSTLHYHLGERFDAHHWRLGVRSRGRVVKIARRA